MSDTGQSGPWHSLIDPYVYEPRPWSKPTTPGTKAPGDNRSFGPVTVPAGRLWVMGDHLRDTADSLYQYRSIDGGNPTASTVPKSDVIGKAVVIAWPPSRWRTLGTPTTFTAMGALAFQPVPASVIGVGLVGFWRRERRRRRS